MPLKGIKKSLLFSVFIIFFVLNFSYGADEDSLIFGKLFISIFDLISSIWYILPIIAGKLLTNDLLYGVSMGLDQLLWEIWNFSRSFANFLIGFLFIYFIFKFISTSNDASLIKTNLPKIAFGSIIINASWFIIAVLIDISTILIAGFGALPLSFYGQDDKSINKQTKIAMPTNIIFDSTKCEETDKGCFNGSYKIIAISDNKMTLNDFQTYQAYVSGPLFFMGANILGIDGSNNLLENAYDVNTNKFKHGGEAVKAFIKMIIMLLFTIPILILIVINVIRIFWIWIYIGFSPLIFLDQIFGGKVASKQKAFAFKNMIGLIFQPALVVLAFSISFIFITALFNTLTTISASDDKKYKDSVKEVFLLDESANGIVHIEGFGQMEDANEVTEFIGGFFSYLILSMLVIILLWTMIRLSFKANEVTSSISEMAFDFTKELVKTVKAIPTPFGLQSMGSLKKLGGNIQSLPATIYSKQASKLAEAFGTKPDIPKYQDIVTNLKSDSKQNINDGYKKAIEELEKYSKDPSIVDNRPGAQEVIKALEEKILKTPLTSIKEQLQKATKSSDKLKIILENQEYIEQYLTK